MATQPRIMRCAWTLFGLPSLALLTMQFDDRDWFFIAEDSVKLFQNSLAREMKQLVNETEPFTETAWYAECFAYQLVFRSLPRRPKDFYPVDLKTGVKGPMAARIHKPIGSKMFLLTRGCILAALRAFCANDSRLHVDSMFASLVAAGCLGVAKPALVGASVRVSKWRKFIVGCDDLYLAFVAWNHTKEPPLCQTVYCWGS